MSAAKNIAGEAESHGKPISLHEQFDCAFGHATFRISMILATIKGAIVDWAIVAIATRQFVLRRMEPQLRLAPIRRSTNEWAVPTKKLKA